MAKYIVKLKPEEYLRRYLKVAPLALAIFRAIEAKNIGSISMRRPILDVGCGFGEFAGVFFDRQVEMGVDISWEELVNAKKGNRYKQLTWADAKKLPFKDSYFKTVLSVSVLEHIDGVRSVIEEIFRVLEPGGQFVFTVNSQKINRFLFWPKFLKKRGLNNLAQKYVRFYHRLFKHKTLWGNKKWRHLLEETGFEVKEIREIISPEATRFFDFFLLTAWPSQLIKLLTGRRWAWRPKWFRKWLVRKYAWLVERDEEEGSNLFIVAIRP